MKSSWTEVKNSLVICIGHIERDNRLIKTILEDKLTEGQKEVDNGTSGKIRDGDKECWTSTAADFHCGVI